MLVLLRGAILNSTLRYAQKPTRYISRDFYYITMFGPIYYLVYVYGPPYYSNTRRCYLEVLLCDGRPVDSRYLVGREHQTLRRSLP